MAGAEGGFAAAKKGLEAVIGETGWINSQVSAGKLALDPEAAEKAAKRCEEEGDALTELINEARAITRVQGLGDYDPGAQLTQRFEDKADGDAGAFPLIRAMQAELDKQAAAFREAAKQYRATDEQNADDFRRGLQ